MTSYKKSVLFKVSHTRKQRDYCDWKMSLFNEFFKLHRIDKRLTLFDRLQKVSYLDHPYPVSSFEFRWQKFLPALYDKCYPYYKQRRKDYGYLLSQIYSPLHLAMWMGDDGNEDRSYCRSKVDRRKMPRSPRYRLAVCSFTEGEINLAYEWFNRHFNLTPRASYRNLKGDRRYPILRFTVAQSRIIHKLTYPYFSQIPSMKYKFRWSFRDWKIEEI